ncbi:AEC family transporter [Thermosyntropha sp.]|uniref:AEC family transporter n=1 Tax=Thermosyntropha sp. TaxID=2740820 RepID=UPI0025FAEF66|nr:AEC family transporter [Thermosyntropha sp.]MBO8158222.1 AEC family transporter [Thermosyntropha sp.]
MLKILSIVLPIFIVLLLGYFLKRMRFLDENFIAVSNRLIFNIFLPLLLFYQIALSNFYDVFNLKSIVLMYVAILLTVFLSYILAGFLKLDLEQTGTFVVDNFRSNVAYVGLPVCYYALGRESLPVAAVLMAFNAPLVNILTVLVLNRNNTDFRLFIKEIILNPLIIAAVLGIIFSVFPINFPVFIKRSFEIVNGVTMPLSLIAIGATISFSGISSSKLVIGLSSMIKLGIMPLFIFLYLSWTQGYFSLADKVLIILMSCPTAVAAYITAAGMNGDEDLASGTIVVNTVLSLFSFIIWLKLLQ